MPSNPNSKEIRWIREFYPGAEDLKPKELNHVLAFGIIWNIFEGVLSKDIKSKSFYGYFNGALEKYAELLDERREDFSEGYKYFSNRYQGLTDEEVRSALLFRTSQKGVRDEDKAYKLVCNTLRKEKFEDIPTEEVLKFLGYIIYRLRNNLFHGEKRYSDLPNQNKNFEHANRVLINILDPILIKRRI
jgi:hypothetical protein